MICLIVFFIRKTINLLRFQVAAAAVVVAVVAAVVIVVVAVVVADVAVARSNKALLPVWTDNGDPYPSRRSRPIKMAPVANPKRRNEQK